MRLDDNVFSAVGMQRQRTRPWHEDRRFDRLWLCTQLLCVRAQDLVGSFCPNGLHGFDVPQTASACAWGRCRPSSPRRKHQPLQRVGARSGHCSATVLAAPNRTLRKHLAPHLWPQRQLRLLTLLFFRRRLLLGRGAGLGGGRAASLQPRKSPTRWWERRISAKRRATTTAPEEPCTNPAATSAVPIVAVWRRSNMTVSAWPCHMPIESPSIFCAVIVAVVANEAPESVCGVSERWRSNNAQRRWEPERPPWSDQGA